jgi:hypothetical protein
LAAGRGSAAAEFQKILDHNGIVWNCCTGALAHLGVARANALEARTSQGAKPTPSQARDSQLFLNLDEPYPRQIFTIVIWGSDRPKFGEPAKRYRDSRVCVTGKITSHQGIPEIAANDPTETEIQK